MSEVAAAILVGGQSRRMGRDKATLRLGGQTVLERLVASVTAAVDGPLALVGRAGELARLDGLAPGAERVCDRDDRPRSALAGIEAALVWSRRPRVLLLACDLPLVPVAVLRALVAPTEADIVAVPGGRRLEPLLAVYRRALASAVTALLDAGRMRADGIQEAVDARALPAAVLREADPDGLAGLNMNTPADLARAQAWLVEGA